MLPTKFQFICLGVSEEQIKMLTDDGRQTTDDGRQVMAKAHFALARWAKNYIGRFRLIVNLALHIKLT
jgi:hypothetical protein